MALSFLRWVRGWDQETLAAASGVKLQSIKAIESRARGERLLRRSAASSRASSSHSRPSPGVRSFIRTVRDQAVSARPSGEASQTSPERPFLASVDLRLELLALLPPPPAAVHRVDGPSALEASRREAAALWARFQTCSEEGRRGLPALED